MNKEEVQSELLNKLNFSPDDINKLTLFHEELLKFNKKYNLISKSTEAHIWDRHILDSAQIVKYLSFEDDKSLSDMGSGAGLPGIILGIFNNNPKFHVKLYEKSNIKCDFLENIKNKLNIECDIYGRYQDEEIHSEYIVSRAFKQLSEVLRISREIVKVNHKLIILKGRSAEEEIKQLNNDLNYSYSLEKSITSPDSKIIILEIKK